MVVSKGFVYHKKHYAGKECKSQTYKNSDLQKRDNVTLHMLKWHLSNLIIKWRTVTAILTDCSLHSTVQYLTKHGNWMNARSNSPEFSLQFHPPTDLQKLTFLCLTPCKCMGFAEAFWWLCVPILSAVPSAGSSAGPAGSTSSWSPHSGSNLCR